jgi:hypothetical protein
VLHRLQVRDDLLPPLRDHAQVAVPRPKRRPAVRDRLGEVPTVRDRHDDVLLSVPHPDLDVDLAEREPPRSAACDLIPRVALEPLSRRLSDSLDKCRPPLGRLEEPRVSLRPGRPEDAFRSLDDPAVSFDDEPNRRFRIAPCEIKQLAPVGVERLPCTRPLVERPTARQDPLLSIVAKRCSRRTPERAGRHPTSRRSRSARGPGCRRAPRRHRPSPAASGPAGDPSVRIRGGLR